MEKATGLPVPAAGGACGVPGEDGAAAASCFDIGDISQACMGLDMSLFSQEEVDKIFEEMVGSGRC